MSRHGTGKEVPNDAAQGRLNQLSADCIQKNYHTKDTFQKLSRKLEKASEAAATFLVYLSANIILLVSHSLERSLIVSGHLI